VSKGVFLEKYIRDTRSLERESAASVRHVTSQLKAKLVDSVLRGYRFDVEKFITDGLLKPFTRILTAAHLAGGKRSTRQVKASGIKLAVHDVIIRNAPEQVLTKYRSEAARQLQTFAASVNTSLQATLLDLVDQGPHLAEAKRVLDRRLSSLVDSRVETLTRTGMQLAYSAGRWEQDQDEAVQEILWGYQYSSVDDARTRPVHAALDGVTLPKEDPFWQSFWPPNGWNCRCVVIPLFEKEPLKRPPTFLADGTPVQPDTGFGFNPGVSF
jgi:SPP1 gp7 family putative phage head morphogenesis protein